jgi:hypothetical protein
MKKFVAAAGLAALLGLSGCFPGFLAGDPPKDASVPETDAIKDETKMTLVDLDQYCMGFGERYLTLLGNSCNQVENAVKDPAVRMRAHSFKLQAASSVYDIATGANPFAKLMDLMLLAELQDLVWGREGLAAKVFGAEAAAPLVTALNEGRAEAWKLGDRILKPEQRAALETMIHEWRERNPQAEAVAFVRFDDFAQYRGKTVLDGVPLGSGLLSPVTEATRQIAETRLVAERSMYLAKRMPLLLRWHAEAFLNTLLARSELTNVQKSVDRIAGIAQDMPAQIAHEREVVLEAAKDRISHAGDEARSVAMWIAVLVAGLCVLVFGLAVAYRKLVPREPVRVATASPKSKVQSPVSEEVRTP